jgi:hypothetical protein
MYIYNFVKDNITPWNGRVRHGKPFVFFLSHHANQFYFENSVVRKDKRDDYGPLINKEKNTVMWH